MDSEKNVPLNYPSNVAGVREETPSKRGANDKKAAAPASKDEEQGSEQMLNVSERLDQAELTLFFAELGVSRTELTNENLWERWIDGYWKYRRTLRRRTQGYLHWRINRFYFMLEEIQYISLIEALSQKKQLRDKHRIRPKDAQCTNAYMWLVLAGAYVEGLKQKKIAADLDSKIERFYIRIPPEWFRDVRQAPRHQLTPYEKFINDLNSNWHRFIRSYENDAHAVTVNYSGLHTPIIGSLKNFVEHKTKHGQRLQPADPRQYWPKPLAWYALKENGARLLYEAKLTEFKAYLIPGAGSGYSAYKTERAIPYWLKLGMD